MQQAYSEYIANLIEKIPVGIPIFTENIASELSDELNLGYSNSKNLTNLNLKRLADSKQIERLQHGVYYKTKETVFGKVKPPMERVLTEIVTKQGREIIGYVTGEAFRHEIGLITLMPKRKEIATNKYRTKTPKANNIILKKSNTKITSKNFQYLQFLDVIDQLDKCYIDADNPINLLSQMAEKRNLDKLMLITLAKNNYSQKTLLRLLDTILEE